MTVLRLRPIRPGDGRPLRAIRERPEVRRWWGASEPGFPEHDEPDAVRQVIEVDGEVAGLIQYYEETTPRYRHASIDVFLAPAWHNRGLGTEALRRTVAHLVTERGHHRVTIDPAAANAAAIRSYEKAGFVAVGVMRDYERDPDSEVWHDGLLMEYVVDGPRSRAQSGSSTACNAAT